MAHPRVSQGSEGEAVFQPPPLARTQYLKRRADLCEQIHGGAGPTRCLADLDLVGSMTLDISWQDGSKNQRLVFSASNEDTMNVL